jgi:hypothetical protein
MVPGSQEKPKELVDAIRSGVPRFQARLVHICPSKPIGSLIWSLIFGGRKFAEHLDALGYHDAALAIQVRKTGTPAYAPAADT